MNELADYFRSKEERQSLKKLELLRRQGERFIQIRYNGDIIPEVDNEGTCYNLRIHGLKDIEIFESTNMNTGRKDWKTRRSARVLYFRQTSNGDIVADVWDDPDHWNRHFISTHPELYVIDDRLREEIEEEGGKPFKAELSRKEELEREVAERLRELEDLTEVEKDKSAPKQTKYRAPKRTGQKKRPGRPKIKETEEKIGINESTPDMDSSGVSRVAAGGAPEGDTAII